MQSDPSLRWVRTGSCRKRCVLAHMYSLQKKISEDSDQRVQIHRMIYVYNIVKKNVIFSSACLFHLCRGITFSTRLHVKPAKTQISVSEYSLFTIRRFGTLAILREPCED